MGIEKFLCVGGVEVANPNRLLAYMRNIGNSCQPVIPSARNCCTCSAWNPEPCTVTIDFGVDTSDSLQFCVGIFALDGLGSGDVLGQVYYFPTECPEERPDLPPMDDPGWVDLGPGEFSAPMVDCQPYGSEPTGECGFIRYVFLDPETGITAEVLAYSDPATVTPGEPGLNAVSFDGGTTWLPGRNSNTATVACAGAGRRFVWLAFFGQEEPPCWLLLNIVGTSGPYMLAAEGFLGEPVPALPPPSSDPGWVDLEVPPGPYPVFPVESGAFCVEDLDPGIYHFTITDGDGDAYQMWWRWDFDALSLTMSYDGITFGALPTTGVVWIDPEPAPGTPPVYSTPAADDAPWYDPAVPESGDVLGVWIEEARLSVPWNRSAQQSLRGASLTRGRLGGRELQIAGWVYTTSEAASAYARQWLFEALAGDGCDSGSCELPDAEVWVHCSDDDHTGRRFLKRVGLTAFDPEIEPEFPRRCGFKFEATLTAEVPELFLEPLTLVDGALLIAEDPELVCTVCNPCPDPVSACSCGGLNAPPRVVQQPDPASLFCGPAEVARTTYQFEPPNLWRDGTLIVTVDAGQDPDDLTAALANLRIRGWVNPAGLDGDDVELLECQEPCIDLEVGCVPARSRLVVDGTTRRAVVVCEGEEQNGFAYLSSSGGQRFAWPDVSCYGLLVAIDADPANTPPDASVTIEFVLRERG